MKPFFSLLFLAAFGFLSSIPVSAQTEWMRDAKLGAMTHVLPSNAEEFAALERDYDPEAVARQLREIGAKYFVFTIFQLNPYLNAPNAAYDAAVGYEPGERCMKRDLPMELADALAKYDIKLILYIVCQPPICDPCAQVAFGLEPGESDRDLNHDFARKFAPVFEWWSDHYGSKVAGWWMDGCYECDFFDEEIGQIYARALKHGNPNALVSFNVGLHQPGVPLVDWKASDFTSGEIKDPFVESCESARNAAGQQEQRLTYIGHYWRKPDCRFTTEQWVPWVREFTSHGGAVTFDMAPTPNGTVTHRQAKQFQEIRKSL